MYFNFEITNLVIEFVTTRSTSYAGQPFPLLFVVLITVGMQGAVAHTDLLGRLLFRQPVSL
jgi:hypothetical protein